MPLQAGLVWELKLDSGFKSHKVRGVAVASPEGGAFRHRPPGRQTAGGRSGGSRGSAPPPRLPGRVHVRVRACAHALVPMPMPSGAVVQDEMRERSSSAGAGLD